MATRGQTDWVTGAQRLAAAIPRERLHPAVVVWADGEGRRRRWGVAVSGGADSIALLLLLWAHWPARRRALRVLHFDHRLRGAASAADARFCVRVCRALGVECVTGRWHDRPRMPGRALGEAAARLARMAFFRPLANTVWLGHQQDDIAESMLMRLARGSGSGGLAAPRPVQRLGDGRVHVRPLLTLKKADLAAALQAAGLVWREDASNRTPAHFRNRVRADVVARWVQAAGRDAVAGAARARALLEEDDAALAQWADELPLFDKKFRLRLAAIAGKPRALVRRALHRWLAAQGRVFELSAQAFEALLDATIAGKPTRHSLGAAVWGEIRGGVLQLVSGGARGRVSRAHQLTYPPGTSTVFPQSTS